MAPSFTQDAAGRDSNECSFRGHFRWKCCQFGCTAGRSIDIHLKIKDILHRVFRGQGYRMILIQSLLANACREVRSCYKLRRRTPWCATATSLALQVKVGTNLMATAGGKSGTQRSHARRAPRTLISYHVEVLSSVCRMPPGFAIKQQKGNTVVTKCIGFGF